LFNANSAIFQLKHGENKLIFNEMMMSKYNIQIVQKGKSNKTQIHAGSVFWFDTDTSIKSGGVKPVVWAKTVK
jgi:hypothetical protein